MGGQYDIGGAKESIANLQRDKVPFYLLTNAGSITEKHEAEIINSKLNSNLAVENVMLCHTPLGAPEMVE